MLRVAVAIGAVCAARALTLHSGDELRSSDDDPLSPLALCAALAVKRGYTLRRGGAPDVHRAGLEVLRDCVDGALCLAFAPPPPEASAE